MSFQHQHQQQPLALSRSKGSNTSNTSTSSISVIVGKTFEATTHPTNGTQQIIEVTKYKRLSDGFIYKETKLRSLEEVLSYDNDDDDNSNVVEERVRRESNDVENVGHHRRVSSGAVTARIHNMKSHQGDPPANNDGISMRNLGPQHPLRQITNQQQVCPPSSISPQRHPIKPSTNKGGGQQQMYPEQEVLSTFSSSYSSNTLGEEQSVITEEHEVFPAVFPQPQQQQGERRYRQQNQGRLSKGGYGQNGRDNNEGRGHYFDEESESYVEEYTYENDAKEYDAQAWQHQQQEQYQQEQYQQEQGRNNVEGWNPFGTDNSIADDSIQLDNRLPSKQQGNKSTSKKLSVSTFFNSGNQFDDEEDNSPIDLKGDEETPSSSGGGGGMFSRSKSSNKLMNCRNISICAMLLVVVGIVVTIGLLVPSIKKNQSQTKLKEEVDKKVPSCIDLGNIDLQIVISSTYSNVEDVNSWSLVRANENGTVSTINSVDDLPEQLTNEEEDVGGQQYTYKNCVEPGLYTFTISDSAGNGLGGGELNEDEEEEKEGGGSSSGYYITANDITLGVSSFFFHEEKMTFTLPFDAEEVEDTSDETAETGDGEEMDTVCTDDFFLAIKTDGKPNESTWNVIDNDTQEEVLSGGPYDMEWTVYTHRACLPNGHYTFNMFDEGEDGVCCDGGKGFFVLQKDGKTIVNSNGEFGSVKSVEFMLGSEEV